MTAIFKAVWHEQVVCSKAHGKARDETVFPDLSRDANDRCLQLLERKRRATRCLMRLSSGKAET